MLFRSEEAKEKLKETIVSGSAFEKFVAFVQAQGGDVDFVRHPEKLPQATYVTELQASQDGWIAGVKAMKLGTLAMELGAGRATKEDKIDPSVGLVINKKVGQPVNQGESLVTIHHARPLDPTWLDELISAFEIVSTPTTRQALIYAKL